MTPEELPDRLPYATDSDDIPYRKEILQALGNAIVPDVAAIALYKFLEIIGCYAAIDGPELPPPSESRSGSRSHSQPISSCLLVPLE